MSYPHGMNLTEAQTYDHLNADESNRTVDVLGKPWRIHGGKLQQLQDRGWRDVSCLTETPHMPAPAQPGYFSRARIEGLERRIAELEARNQQLEAAIRAAAELVTR